MNSIFEWIRTNWNEESNVGKAKLGAVAALIFVLIAALLPDRGHEPALVSPSSGVDKAAEAEADAARQAAAAYSSYEARVAELERERAELIARQSEAGPLDEASEEVAATIRAYAARISELEQEKRELTGEMARLEAGGEAYAGYAARIAELELAHQALIDQLASKDRRIAELERRLASGGEDGGVGNMELRLQLEAMRATLDQLLKKLE